MVWLWISGLTMINMVALESPIKTGVFNPPM